jgi:CRP/FNR family transcriptional regulator
MPVRGAGSFEMSAQLVEQFPFLASLSAPARRMLSGLPVRRVAARSDVLRKGDEVEGVFLLTRGALRIFHLTAAGREATLYWVRPGQTCILALSATFRRERYPAWAETDAAAISFVIVPERMFRELLIEPAFRDFVLGALSGRVFELMVSLEERGSLRVDARLAAFLLRHADQAGTVRISQERLAAHLGSAREVVSRVLRSLVARGLVATARSRIRIVDRRGLEQLAGQGDEAD